MLEQSVTRSHLKPLPTPLHNSISLSLSLSLSLHNPKSPKQHFKLVSQPQDNPMSHHPTYQRNLAKSSQDPKTTMDPTHKKHPKSPPFINTTTITTKPHPKPQEPTIIYSPNVQNISNHFSRLYSNHKALSSSNPSGPPLPQAQPSIDTHFQAKPMSQSTISDVPMSKNTRKYRRNVSDLNEGSPKNGLNKSIKKSSEESLDTKREIKTDEIKKPTTNKEIVIVETKNQEIEVLKRPSVLVAAGGRRRSFCSSKTELADFLSCNGVKVVSADMPPFMQIHAVDFARKTYDSLEKFTAKTLASTLKKEFDGVYGPAWHCIVGTSFGSFVTHSVGGFLYFSMDHKLYILLFKTTVQKAE